MIFRPRPGDYVDTQVSAIARVAADEAAEADKAMEAEFDALEFRVQKLATLPLTTARKLRIMAQNLRMRF